MYLEGLVDLGEEEGGVGGEEGDEGVERRLRLVGGDASH